MKRLLNIVLIGLFFLSTLELPAATHAVRKNASGAADGTTWDDAFTDLPGTLTRGDIYCVADNDGGANYVSYTFNDALSGSTLITIQHAEDGDGSCDQLANWVASYGDGQAVWSPQMLFTEGFYTWDGVSRTALDAGHGFKIDNATGGSSEPIHIQGDSDSITLRYFEVQGSGDTGGGPNDRSIDITGPGMGNFFDDLVIEFCHLFDSGADNLHTSRMDGFTIQNCLISKNDSEPATHSELWADDHSKNVTNRYNVWRNMEGTGGIIQLNRGGDPDTDVDNWDHYGNVFYTDQNEGISNGAIACINLQQCNNWKIYNNTFWDLSDLNSIRTGIGFGGAGSGSDVEIFNNLWQESRKVNHNCGTGVTCTLDSQVYTDITDSNDKSGETNVQIRDSFNWFVNKASADFHLVEATDDGVNTSAALPGNDLDIDGNTRGADGVWDRGAYEFVSGNTGVTISVKASGAVIVQ